MKMPTHNTERIGIIMFGYGLKNSPTLINTGKILAKEGYSVDYFTFNTFVDDLDFSNKKINIYRLDKRETIAKRARFGDVIILLLPLFFRRILSKLRQNLYRLISKLLNAFFYRKRFIKFEQQFLNSIQKYVDMAENIARKWRYKCLIGVEPQGLVAATSMSQKNGAPVIYFNLELALSSEASSIRKKIMKKYEKIANQTSHFTITQDDERARLLAKDNEIPLQNIVTVPVCADGPIFEKKTNWFREKFNLSESDQIILYAGFISEWAMSEELANCATLWPKNRILILHSHGYHDERYLRRVKKYEGHNVKISLEGVPYEILPSLLASADLGILLYKDLGKNFTLINSASGKLSHYLKCGLPVIANDNLGMRRLFTSYECGACIKSLDEINDVMDRIFANYSSMRINAFRCYQDNYVFSKHFSRVIDKIKEL